MPRRTMLALADKLHPQQLSIVIANPESNAIELARGGQVRTSGVAKIALAQPLIGTPSLAVERTAAPGEAVSQRQPLPMRP